MKKSVFTFILVLVPFLLYSQSFEPNRVSEGEPIDSTRSERVIHPATDPYVYYYAEPVPPTVLQSGAFVGTADAGMEVSLQNIRGYYFSSLFFSSVNDPGGRDSDIGYMMTGGIMAGPQYLLHSTRGGSGGADFYARIGPGFGIAGVGMSDRSGTDYYFGFHTLAMVGAVKDLSDNISLYAEMGGRTAWYPTLNEVGLIGGPQFSIGIRFSRSGSIPMIRF